MSEISRDALVHATASIVAARITTSAMLTAAGKPTVMAAQPIDDIFFETYRLIEKAIERIDLAQLGRSSL